LDGDLDGGSRGSRTHDVVRAVRPAHRLPIVSRPPSGRAGANHGRHGPVYEARSRIAERGSVVDAWGRYRLGRILCQSAVRQDAFAVLPVRATPLLGGPAECAADWRLSKECETPSNCRRRRGAAQGTSAIRFPAAGNIEDIGREWLKSG